MVVSCGLFVLLHRRLTYFPNYNADELSHHQLFLLKTKSDAFLKAPQPWRIVTYIIRDDAAVTPRADGLAANYDIPENEMTCRMPHQDLAGADLPTYIHDRSKVWQTMAEICRDDKCWTYVKPFQRSHDGAEPFKPCTLIT